MGRFWMALGAALVSAVAFAQVTSLVTIPVADIKGVREAEFGHFVTGYEKGVDPRYYHSAYLLVGVHERLELEGSTNYLGTDSWGFKVKAFEGPKGQCALSGGFQAIRGKDSVPFVVGRYDLGPVRLHGGWQRTDTSQALFGLDCCVCEGLTFGADFASGPSGSAWAGFFWSVPGCQGLSLDAFVGVPNDRSGGLMHSVGFVYAFRF